MSKHSRHLTFPASIVRMCTALSIGRPQAASMSFRGYPQGALFRPAIKPSSGSARSIDASSSLVAGCGLSLWQSMPQSLRLRMARPGGVQPACSQLPFWRKPPFGSGGSGHNKPSVCSSDALGNGRSYQTGVLQGLFVLRTLPQGRSRREWRALAPNLPNRREQQRDHVRQPPRGLLVTNVPVTVPAIRLRKPADKKLVFRFGRTIAVSGKPQQRRAVHNPQAAPPCDDSTSVHQRVQRNGDAGPANSQHD
jgi:hypothetical protein